MTDRLQNGDILDVSGHKFRIDDGRHVAILPRPTVRASGADYGCDPLGEDAGGVFRWRMVPSGDVVGLEEMRRRLGE